MNHRWMPWATLVILSSCQDPNDATVLRDVQVSFATTHGQVSAVVLADGAGAAAQFMDDTIVSGTDTLILSSVEMVLRKVELERLGSSDCDVQPDVCEDFEAGPVLVDVPLDGTVQTEFALPIPAGSYGQLEFDIHKVSKDDAEDASFRAAHPDFVEKSIRVTGTFNGQAFVFETDLNVEQELDLSPPLVIDAPGSPANITVLVGLDGWFRDGANGLLDPATGNKGQPNESIINENIKTSIEAFEDEDRNGER